MFNDKDKDNNKNINEPVEQESEKEESKQAQEAENLQGSETEAKDSAQQEAEKVKKPKFEFTKKRSFKFGSMATAFTAVFVAIVILVNVGLTVITQKYPISIDLTQDKNYNLSQETIEYIKKVDTPITIKIFATKAQLESYTDLIGPAKIIEQYPQYNNKISLEFIDYDKNPTAVAQYQNENISQGDIVVTARDANNSEHYKHLSIDDLLITEYDSSYNRQVVGNKAEQQIDNAIDYVTSEDLPKILFTQGHDEAGYSDYQSLLKDANYSVDTVNTTSSDIDEDADALVIVAPSADFSDSEIDKIDKFLKNDGKFGKNIFVFLDPRCPSLPNLEDYLTEWGVKVESGAIYDTTNSYSENIFDVIASKVDTDVVGDNVSTDIGTDVRIARPLTILFDSKDARKVTSVIETGDTSQLLEDLSGTTSSSDKKGPYTVMTLSTWSSTSSSTLTKSNMIVSGSYEMLNGALLNASNRNNSKVLLGINNKLMEKEATITVPSKYNDSTSLSITRVQRSVIFMLFVIIIPLALLITGLVIWLRRRHL